MTNVVVFDHPDRIERAYWARRRFGPLAFDQFMAAYGIVVDRDGVELLRAACNSVLAKIEEDEGQLAALRAISCGDERIAAVVSCAVVARRSA